MRCMEAVQSFDSSSRHDNMREKYDCRDSCLWACKDTKHPNNCFIRNMEASLMETDQMTWFKLLFVLSSQVIFFQWAGSWILHRNKSVFSFAAFFSGGGLLYINRTSKGKKWVTHWMSLEEGRGRGVTCPNILCILPLQQSCQSQSEQGGICHRIVAMAMTSALMSHCDTCKYNKQTAGLHTHTKWVSVARQDHGRQHTQKQHCSFCTTKCVHIHRPILVHISETTTKRWCIQPCYTKLTMLRWEKSLELVTLGTVVWHHITA